MWEEVCNSVRAFKDAYLGTTNMERLEGEIVSLGFLALRGTFSGPDSKYFVCRQDRSVMVMVHKNVDSGIITAISVI